MLHTIHGSRCRVKGSGPIDWEYFPQLIILGRFLGWCENFGIYSYSGRADEKQSKGEKAVDVYHLK